jgi:hypothetical protein
MRKLVGLRQVFLFPVSVVWENLSDGMASPFLEFPWEKLTEFFCQDRQTVKGK